MAGPVAQAKEFVERRRISRKRVSIPCWIERGLLPPIPCAATDYSVEGAQLRFERHETVASLPSHFTLKVPRAPGTGGFAPRAFEVGQLGPL